MKYICCIAVKMRFEIVLNPIQEDNVLLECPSEGKMLTPTYPSDLHAGERPHIKFCISSLSLPTYEIKPLYFKVLEPQLSGLIVVIHYYD
jgi:hypothetical protein